MPAAGQPTLVLQGIETPNVSVDPDAFFKYTRRLRFPMKSPVAIAGLGSTDNVFLRQTGVVSKLLVRVSGTIVLGGTITGTVTTWNWPYGLIRGARVSANGQANVINVPGDAIKVTNAMQPLYLDAGVSRTVGATTGQTTGTLSLSPEDWGTSGVNLLGPGVTAAATGTYTVDLYFEIPVSFDDKTLVGAIYAQTSATQLTLDIDWETQANLLTLGGSATFSHTLQYQVLGEVFSIPQVGGRFVVPDLSVFHSLIGWRYASLAQGDNEILLPGTGVGRQLMRLFGNVVTGTAPGTPLALTAANFGQIAWRYGGNDTPEMVQTGPQLRYINQLDYGVDLGKSFGYWCYDFATNWAFRDSVDEGATTDLRAVINLVNTPTTGVARMVQETLFAAPTGA